MKKYIICDLDGTLFTAANGEPWYDRNFLIDKTIPEVKELLRRFSDHCLLFVTGRKEKYRGETCTRLYREGFDVLNNSGLELFMRRNMDNRHDAAVKEEIYQIKIKPHYEIAFVLDDLEECCQMWKRQGLFVFQVVQDESKNK